MAPQGNPGLGAWARRVASLCGRSMAVSARSQSRSAARLAAVQALYQHEMEQTPIPLLLHEFHHHRLGATIEGVEYAEAEVDFFDDLVSGAEARSAELD